MSQINEMKFGIEIYSEGYSEGYNGGVRVYQNTKDISDLYRDEIKYVNQRIATIVSRYREMYRYQIMMSSTYSVGWRVEFDANQIQDVGFNGTNSGVDSIYSDLDSLSIQFSEELNGVLDNVVKAYEFSRECNDVCGVKSQYVGNEDKRYWEELLDTVVKGITDVLERFYVYYVSNGISLYRGYVLVSQVLDNLQLGADSYTCMADSFTDVIGSIELGDYFEYQGCVFSYDDSLESIEMYIPIREFNTKVMASRVFDVGKLMRSYVDMVEEYSRGIYSIS